MASYILPNVCSIGIISQENPNTSLTAAKLKTPIDANANGLFIQAHSTNGDEIGRAHV